MLENIITNFWFIQLIGIIALGYAVFAFQGVTRKSILYRQITSAGLFVAHFFLLQAYTGALQNLLIISRNIVFEKRDKRLWVGSKWCLIIFLLLPVILVIFTWEGWISIFPVLGLIIGTYARWQDTPALIRIFSLISVSMWIPYNVVVLSYAGILNQVIIIVFILFAIHKLDRKKIQKDDLFKI